MVACIYIYIYVYVFLYIQIYIHMCIYIYIAITAEVWLWLENALDMDFKCLHTNLKNASSLEAKHNGSAFVALYINKDKFTFLSGRKISAY